MVLLLETASGREVRGTQITTADDLCTASLQKE